MLISTLWRDGITAMAGFDMSRPSQKVIVLITDGEDHGGDALAMAEMAAEQGVMLYTIGFGSPDGEPIPEYDARGEVVGYKRDEQGEVVLSRLDEATLQEIAQVGGGQYYRATAGGSELAALISELGTLLKGELSALLEVQHIERFQPFLLAALALLVAMEIIPDRVRRVAKQRTAMRGQWVVDSGQ